MTASLSGVWSFQALASDGTLADGYRLYTYITGTTTHKVAYTDAAGSVAHTYTSDGVGGQYIALNARGELPAPLFFTTGAYDLTLKTPAGATVWTRYAVGANDIATTLIADLADSSSTSKGDALVAVKRTASSAVATTEHAWHESQPINAVSDFGCDNTGSADCTTALQAALAAAISQKKSLYIPGGTYKLNGAAGADSFANGLLVPFNVVNADPSDSVLIYGDAGLTRLQCGSDTMILLRISRNCVSVRDITIEGNGHSNVWGVGIVPESITQTTTLVSNSFSTLTNVIVESCTEGIVYQPGPHVGGSDSGGFYHRVFGGMANSNTRAVWFKKNVDWAGNPNKTTRTSFYGFHCLRGNTGYWMDAGSEIELHSCSEELIDSGVTPSATPCARVIGAACSNIRFYGGYTEACTTSVSLGAANIVTSYAYSFNSAPDVAAWAVGAISYDDMTQGAAPTSSVALSSSGGGAQGAGTVTCNYWKMGKLCTVLIVVNVAKGTLGAGNLAVTGLPFASNAAMGQQALPVPIFGNITMSAAAYTGLGAFINAGGSTLNLRKCRNDGAADASLTVAECGATITFTIQGTYMIA